MSALTKIDGKALFGATRWQRMVTPSNWQGAALVVHAWAVIALAAAFAVALPHPLVVIAAIIIIGSRQLGLSILMHDAAHGVLLKDRRYNDWTGQWLCALPVGLDMHAYRGYHMKHHRFAQQAEDPDLPLSAKFPVSRSSMLRKLLRDLTGWTFLRVRVVPLLADLRHARMPSLADRAWLVSSVAGLTLAAAFGYALWFFLLWMLPLATWQMLVLRIRNIGEHACVGNGDDPWHLARTTQAGWLGRALLAPYYVNFHAEHHLFMTVPCYRLPSVHAALDEAGLLQAHDVPIASHYGSVLAAATASGGRQ
ncbi:MAG: fatty acid desaturase family protein [Pseudomonadota bacterium]